MCNVARRSKEPAAVVLRIEQRYALTRFEFSMHGDREKRFAGISGRRSDGETTSTRPYPRIVDQAGVKGYFWIRSCLSLEFAPHPYVGVIGHPELTAEYDRIVAHEPIITRDVSFPHVCLNGSRCVLSPARPARCSGC